MLWSGLSWSPSEQQHTKEFCETFGMRCFACTCGGICTLHAEMMKRYNSDRAAVVTATGTSDFISCLKGFSVCEKQIGIHL